jgi:hypothetical protein
MIEEQFNKHEHFIRLYDNVLTNQLIQDLIAHSHVELGDSLVGGGDSSQNDRNDTDRQDYQKFLNYTDRELKRRVHEAIEPHVSRYVEEFPILKNIGTLSSIEVKLQRTPASGGFHNWHCENDAAVNSGRVISWHVYLNTLKPGEGETEFIYQGIKVPSKEGTLVLSPAGYTHTHRGNPPYSGDKYIVTGWYCYGTPLGYQEAT